jgi:tRNA(Ile)-lysidine synthase
VTPAGPGAALVAAARPVLDRAPPGAVGVAVSGGGDSVALLLVVLEWAAGTGRDVRAATVDHGLRAASAGEAEAVAGLCARLGVPHAVLRWRGWDGRGNLSDAARAGRLGLLADWARAQGIGAVAFGHTEDDQAETVLMRLARGSGVDGLAGIAPASEVGGLVLLHPLLGVSRAALRAHLEAAGIGWTEDPSNADPAFARVRARRALAALAPLGLGTARLAATAAALGRARRALEVAAAELAARCLGEAPGGEAMLDPAPFAAAEAELRLRVLAGALGWVAGAVYRPRLATLERAEAAIVAGRIGAGMTLHGCVLRPRRDGAIAIRREPRRVGPPVSLSARRWDGRWELGGGTASDAGLVVGALGAAGLAARPRWRLSGVSRETLLTTPAVWQGERLVAAPALDADSPWTFIRVAPLRAPWVRPVFR